MLASDVPSVPSQKTAHAIDANLTGPSQVGRALNAPPGLKAGHNPQEGKMFALIRALSRYILISN